MEEVRFVTIFPKVKIGPYSLAGIGYRCPSCRSCGTRVGTHIEAVGELGTVRHGLIGLKKGGADSDDGWVVGRNVRADNTDETCFLRFIKDGDIPKLLDQ